MELNDLLDILLQDTESLNNYIHRTGKKEKILSEVIHMNMRNTRPKRVSQNVPSTPKISIDSAFKELCLIFNKYSGDFKMPHFIERVIPQLEYEKDNTYVIPFSGGKVSLALAIRYRNVGKRICLYHVHNNYNLGTIENVDRVKKLAEMLNVPLYIDEVNYRYFDNSLMKNPLIICRALKFAVENGYGSDIPYGTFETAYLSNNDFNKTGGSCVEFLNAYNNAIRKFYFSANIIMPFPAYSMVWDELISSKRYLKYVSCNGEIERMIWYIAQVDHNLLEEKNTSLYMKYIKELKNKLESSPGDINKLWNKYFFYRIEKSKHYQELMKLS